MWNSDLKSPDHAYIVIYSKANAKLILFMGSGMKIYVQVATMGDNQETVETVSLSWRRPCKVGVAYLEKHSNRALY